MPPRKGATDRRHARGSGSGKKRNGGAARPYGVGARFARSGGDREAEAQESQIVMRTLGFAVLAVLLSACALTFLVSALKNSPGDSRVVISVPAPVRRYTVKVLEEAAGQRRVLEALARRPELRALAGEHGFFLCGLPGGGSALCAGSFSSKDATGARSLLTRFRAYRLEGRRVFEYASIWGFRPGGREGAP